MSMYRRVLTYQQPVSRPVAQSNQTLKIILSKPSFFIDDFIEGQVELTSSVQIIINDINIVLNSVESWQTFSKELNYNISEKTNEAIVSVNLDVKRKLNIDSNLVALKAGKFNFGFKFQIPKPVAPSFEFPSAIEGKAYIRYFLVASIVSPYVSGNFTTYIILKQRQKIEMNKQVSFSVETSTHKAGIFDGGKCTMTVSSINGTDNFRFGDSAHFNINIDNSKGKLSSTECKVVMTRVISFKNKLSEKKKTVTDELISKVVKMETLPKENKNFGVNLSLKDVTNNNFNIKEAKLPYTNIEDINFFLPTIKTIILECSYNIKFTLYFNSFVKYKDRPRIIMNMIMCHQSFEEYKNEMDARVNMNNMMPPQLPPNMMPPNMPPNMPHGMPPNIPHGMPPYNPHGMPPNIPHGMPPYNPHGMPPNMPPYMPPNNMGPMANNNGIPNTPLSKRNMSLPPPQNQQFNQMNNNMNNNMNDNNQDMDLPSMEELEENKINVTDEGNFNNEFNNGNNNFNENYNNNNNYDNYNNNYNNDFNNNQNMNENNNDNNEPPLPPLSQDNNYPEYPVKPGNNNY